MEVNIVDGIASVYSRWTNGVLEFVDSSNNVILSLSPSSGGLKVSNALTVSSGLTIDGQAGSTATAATSLTIATHGGKVVKCATDGVFFTLPLASTTTLQGGEFTIRNTATAGGAQIILITTTTESIIGAGISTSNLLANTKATAKPGDYVTVSATGSSSWYVVGLVGTWASTT